MVKADSRKFNIRERLRSFSAAFSGLSTMIRGEHNFRIHTVLFLIVIAGGIFLRITLPEWIMIFIVSGMVFSAECFNSAIEYLSDEVSPEYSDRIKKTKDIAAAGVLIAAIAAVLTGVIIFIPRIIQIIK